MNRSALHLVAALALTAVATAAHGQIVNPSFEQTYPNPDTEGWLLPVGWNVGYSDSAWTDSRDWLEGYFPILPTHGQWMAGLASNSLSQQVALNAGDQVLVDVAMYCDATVADGSAVLRLGDWQNPTAIARSSVWMSSYGPSLIGWHTLSLTVPATGTYELVLQGTSGGTGDGTISFYFDNVRIVPAPGTAALLGLGGVLVTRRRR